MCSLYKKAHLLLRCAWVATGLTIQTCLLLHPKKHLFWLHLQSLPVLPSMQKVVQK